MRPSSTGGRPGGTRRTPWPWASAIAQRSTPGLTAPLRLRLAAGGSGMEAGQDRPQLPPHDRLPALFGALRPCRTPGEGAAACLKGDGVRRTAGRCRAPSQDGSQGPVLDRSGPCSTAAPQRGRAVVARLVPRPWPPRSGPRPSRWSSRSSTGTRSRRRATLDCQKSVLHKPSARLRGGLLVVSRENLLAGRGGSGGGRGLQLLDCGA